MQETIVKFIFACEDGILNANSLGDKKVACKKKIIVLFTRFH